EAFGSDEKELAQQLTEALFSHVQDPKIKENEGIPAHLQKHALCFMTLIVAMESKALFGKTYQSVLDDCLYKSLYVFANDELQAPFEYVGKDGKPVLQGEGRLIDPGHTLESLWFAMHTGQQENNDAYKKRAKTILNWVLRLGWDPVYGGFYQYVDVQKGVPEDRFLYNSYDGFPVAWDDKIWWVQAEGLYTLLLSSLLNGEENHFSYFLRLHDFTQKFFMDKTVGEWNSICQRNGTVKDGRKGFALKGPYHVMRAYVQMVQVLEKALE
ncbi:MAG: AGE family epimerase/isomerase, partial [Pygmaiobacter massiliensis]|nr:AGE family epimerase/isomerase [Pygmaiobacter massiliensis]